LDRKSQIEKFYQKWYKQQEDTRAIIEGQMRKEKETKWYGDVEGVEELMEKGNIKEAAVVFSREGMEVFTKLFSNYIERRVEETLNKGINDLKNKIEEHIEKSVEKKLVEMLEGITEGIKQFANENTEMSQPIIRNIKIFDPTTVEIKNNIDLSNMTISNGTTKPEEKTTEQIAEEVTTATKEVATAVEAPTVEKPVKKSDKPVENEGIRILGLKDAEEVLPLVVNIMKSHGGPMRLTDINNKLIELHNMKFTSSGCTSFINKLIKLDYNIEKVGYGLYEYREKNFKPTL
jgi:hypothetical protein